jgi:hypothetical protein
MVLNPDQQTYTVTIDDVIQVVIQADVIKAILHRLLQSADPFELEGYYKAEANE